MILLNLADRRIHDLNRKIKEPSELFVIDSGFKFKSTVIFLQYVTSIAIHTVLMAINSKHMVLNQIRLLN